MTPGETHDDFLTERLAYYDMWLQERKIPAASKVIPIHEAIQAQQWVLPTERVLTLVRDARSIALMDCICRSHYQRCNNPVETCLSINDAADRYVREGRARQVSVEEAAHTLQRANEHGLVHLTIYSPDQHPYAICSCCACCCHELQLLKQYKRSDLVARSDYVAWKDPARCIQCGECIERCVFDAHSWDDGDMMYDVDACYGCGLCVTTCSEEAITLRRRISLTKA